MAAKVGVAVKEDTQAIRDHHREAADKVRGKYLDHCSHLRTVQDEACAELHLLASQSSWTLRPYLLFSSLLSMAPSFPSEGDP